MTQFHGNRNLCGSRRSFLQAASAGVLGAWLCRSGSGADVIQRSGAPYFKLSLAAYSFRDQLSKGWPTPSGKPGTISLLDVIDFCAAQNIEAVELTSYYFPNPLTKEGLLKIKQHAFLMGVDISGTAIGNDFCLPDGPARDAQLQLCRQWIDYAAELGAPVIRIFAGRVPAGSTEEQAVAQCVRGIDESLQYAAQRGVLLALENHGGITATPDQLLRIVEQVTPSPWFGVNFDSGNFATADPYGDLKKIAPYTINAQMKVSINPQGQAKQPADYARIIDILKEAGYRGYLVLEYEESADPLKIIPEHLSQLRKLISA